VLHTVNFIKLGYILAVGVILGSGSPLFFVVFPHPLWDMDLQSFRRPSLRFYLSRKTGIPILYRSGRSTDYSPFDYPA